jgi:hypothetical protein
VIEWNYMVLGFLIFRWMDSLLQFSYQWYWVNSRAFGFPRFLVYINVILDVEFSLLPITGFYALELILIRHLQNWNIKFYFRNFRFLRYCDFDLLGV